MDQVRYVFRIDRAIRTCVRAGLTANTPHAIAVKAAFGIDFQGISRARGSAGLQVAKSADVGRGGNSPDVLEALVVWVVVIAAINFTILVVLPELFDIYEEPLLSHLQSQIAGSSFILS